MRPAGDGSLPRLIPLLLLAAAAAACEEVEQVVDRYRDLTPHEAYTESLREAGLLDSALGRDWLEAADAAMASPDEVTLPFGEERFITPERPDAAGYRLSLQRGQVLRVTLGVDGGEDATRVFLELFRLPEDPRDAARPLAGVDTLSDGLRYEPRRDGDFLLRIQPELLRGGRFRVALNVGATLAFPVQGRSWAAVQSFWGADRDGGARSHHGVDIFAPRGTPAVAAAVGRVSRVQDTRRGGKVVWLYDPERSQSMYYAHLDSQYVTRGQLVKPGDTVGFVGNTGNAVSTPPHLHFGIYVRRRGPVDPRPYLRPPPGEMAPLTADTARLGGWVRTASQGIRVRRGPSTEAEVAAELPRHTPLRVLGASGAWYRVALPDGAPGYVSASLMETADRPLRTATAEEPRPLQARPDATATPVAAVDAGAELGVLGEFAGWLYVRAPDGAAGWWAAGDG